MQYNGYPVRGTGGNALQNVSGPAASNLQDMFQRSLKEVRILR